ncbi:MAG TPA: hypothetical protein K8V08_01255 [Brevibacterium senegalense]|uniref:Uncharacterized protein n=1 Tax=Brevibacterium senegalense TaxID=1033736 RepID=A0A921MBZ2_9MICO|nr:hypothetical protein [Brevibacterium senegalense]
MSVASTTGVWANIDPREAVAHGADLASTRPHLLPFPLMSSPAAGGTRWAADALGLAVQLLPGLPADIGPAGWRLLGGRAATAARTLDARREASRLSRAFDALGEYAESSDLPVLVSVPGPWTLTRRLGLPDESPVLGDPGARRDVLQSYAHGLLGLRERIHRVVAGSPDTPLDRVRIRLVEEDLDAILTGRVPTVSGYRTLPAVPDAHVVAGLRSVVQRTGEGTILSLPGLSTVRIGGKDIPHTSLVDDAGVRHLCVPLRPVSWASETDPLAPALLRQWERLAEWTETGGGVWLRIPGEAAAAAGSVTSWVEAAALPWTRVGMGRAGLADFGILTGEELPTGSVPLLPEQASAQRSRTHVQMAGALARAFADQAG